MNDMNVICNDRDRIFKDGTPAEWAALETHAVTCTVCAEEVRAWKSLSVAAQELRDYSDSSALWPRIERALAEEAARNARRGILTISAGWIYLHRSPTVGTAEDPSLLKATALKEVESAETAYEHAIDKLAAEARPQLDNAATPLLANYHEKLLVLDSAIDDLRVQAGLNPSNAQLRYQLLAMYQEKQHTLEEVLETKR